MVQLPEVHPRTVRPIERSSRVQKPDAKSRGTQDNTVRLRHVEPARVPLRHAALSPPQLSDLLHHLAKEQSRRPPDFLSGHAYQDGKQEHRGDSTQKVDLFRGVCGVHGKYEPNCAMFVELVGGAGCVGGQEEEWMGCFLDDFRAFGINADQWTATAQDERQWRRTAEHEAECFTAKWITTAEKARAGLRRAVIYPNVTGRIKRRIAQSKRARAGSLSIVN